MLGTIKERLLQGDTHRRIGSNGVGSDRNDQLLKKEMYQVWKIVRDMRKTI